MPSRRRWGQCLERGQRYAWSVAVAADVTDWSPPFLFEIEAAPSLEEVEQAIATLQRYRDHHLGDEPPAAASAIAAADVPEPLGGGSSRAQRRMRERHTLSAADSPLPKALTSPTSGVVRVASAATPTLGIPSLKVSANVALGAASNLFKNGQVFLWDDTTGNTALGRTALSSASGNATNNTALGRDALHNTTGGVNGVEGSFNTAAGVRALYSNTTGYSNTASGYAALRANNGDLNTASGASALRNNSTGNDNTASGHAALFANITGYRNTASGSAALFSNSTGFRNTASGYAALRYNTTGTRNTASGSAALFSNTNGSRNTASGDSALLNNSTGNHNTASGALALRDNTSGYRNTASGYLALYSNTTGDRNTALGVLAGSGNTTGNDSIFINNLGVSTDTATIKIGTQGTQQSTFIAGIHAKNVDGVSDAFVLVDNTGKLGTAVSSRRFKQDIQDLGSLTRRLLELRPVAFRYREHATANPDTPLQFGLIAEEVAEVFPELVVYDKEGNPESVKYHLLISLLLGELQEQQGELDILRAKHQADLERLAVRLDALESASPGATRSRDDHPAR